MTRAPWRLAMCFGIAGLLSTGIVSAPAATVRPPGPAASAAATPPEPPQHTTRKICGATVPGRARCFAEVQTDTVQPLGLNGAGVTPNVTPSGLSPADLISAYNLPSGGAGQTIGVVDPYDDPNAEADLAVYRAQYGLSACTTANGCFRKVNQSGQASPLPAPDAGWAPEVSLDLDMVSAICPNCKIVLVETASNFLSDLGIGVNRAVSMGARFVSNSYGGMDSTASPGLDSSYYNHPGVVITASTGDAGSDGLSAATYPAAGAGVVAVGGTTLIKSTGTSRGWIETAWAGAGSGCSQYVNKPGFQAGVTTGCAKRATADVSAIANPNTGVSVYVTYGGSGWAVYGGTSASAPIVAGVYALAGTPNPLIPAAALPYQRPSSLNDITAGTNGTCGAPLCSAGTGWDGPTGMGTPNGTAAFAPTSSVTGDLIINGGFESGTTGWDANTPAGVFDPTVVPPFAGSGTAAARSSTAGGRFFQLVNRAVSPGQTYCVTAQVASWGTSGASGALTLTSDGGSAESTSHHFSGLGLGVWIPEHACLTLATAHTGLQVQFAPDVNTPVLSVDNVSLALDRVSNGGFEAGTSGWSATTSFGVFGTSYLNPYEGANAAGALATTSSGQFSQFVAGAVSAGQTYCLSAASAAWGSPGMGVTVVLATDGGAPTESVTQHFAGLTVGNWQPEQVCLAVTGSHTRLLAKFYPDPNGGILTVDAVHLN